MNNSSDVPGAAARNSFQSTQWSVVLRAGQRGDDEADAALATLCERYWFPLYAYVRRRVSDVHQAQDLTQEFFAWLLTKDALRAASPERGRFRAFLLTVLKNFLANQWDCEKSKKRGGGVYVVSLDLEAGETRVSREPSHDLTPDRLYERHWVRTLLDLVLRRLEAEYRSTGRLTQFQQLRGALGGDHDRLPYVELGAQMGISEEGARQAASRLRRRYRDLLRDEVSQTLANPGDIDEEIKRLFAAFQG
jgi:RNA polymerase sigma-70 factor (ECF subfamily)